MKLSLTVKLLLLILPMIILPLGVLAYLTFNMASEQAFKQTTVANRANINSVQQEFLSRFTQLESTLSVLASSSLVQTYLTLNDSPELYELVIEPVREEFDSFMRADTRYDNFTLLSAAGEETFSFPNKSLLSDTGLLKYFDLDEENTQLKIIDNEDGLKQLIGVRPVYETNGELNQQFIGYIAIAVSIEQQFTELNKQNSNNHFAYLSLNGTAIKNAEKFEVSSSDIKVLGYHDGEENVSYKGNEYWRFNSHLSHGYLITSLLSASSIETQMRDITGTTSLVTLLCLIIAPLAISLTLRKTLLKPIDMLFNAHTAAGEGDLSIRLPEKRKDEFGDLFKVFNNMVYQLRVVQRNLELHREHLEEKVERRTELLKSSNHKLEYARKEAESANAMKSNFLANMSHEMRTPLTAILGFAEHANNETTSSSERSHALNKVVRNGNHLLQLINDVLDLTKIEAGKLDVEIRQINIPEIISDTEFMMAMQAKEKDIDFNINYAYPLPEYIMSDSTRLQQILINLLGNAIKFTQQGFVKLDIRYEYNNNSLVFDIVDTGIGLSPQQQEKLFTPFTQADVTTTRKFGGSGLGLSISKSLAENLGGNITLQSEEGKGSTFSVMISCGDQAVELVDLYKTVETPDITESNDEDTTSISGRLLLAEDNKDNQALISLLFARTSVEFEIVEDGKQALEKAINEDYDLILMDMQMPIMGGLQTTSLLRQSGYDKPILALTANNMKSDLDEQRNAGCDQSLSKPINQDQFFSALRKYLPSKATLEEKKMEEQALENDLYADPAFLEIVKQFKDRLPESLSNINRAWEQRSWPELASFAHSLKGSAGMFGFQNITDLAATIEKAAKAEQEDDIAFNLESLQALCDNVT